MKKRETKRPPVLLVQSNGFAEVGGHETETVLLWSLPNSATRNAKYEKPFRYLIFQIFYLFSLHFCVPTRKKRTPKGEVLDKDGDSKQCGSASWMRSQRCEHHPAPHLVPSSIRVDGPGGYLVVPNRLVTRRATRTLCSGEEVSCVVVQGTSLWRWVPSSRSQFESISMCARQRLHMGWKQGSITSSSSLTSAQHSAHAHSSPSSSSPQLYTSLPHQPA